MAIKTVGQVSTLSKSSQALKVLKHNHHYFISPSCHPIYTSLCATGDLRWSQKKPSPSSGTLLFTGATTSLCENRTHFSNTLRFVTLSPPTLCSLARLPSRRLDPHLKPSKRLQAQITKSQANVKLSCWPTSPCPHSTDRYHIGTLPPTLDQLVVSFSLMLTVTAKIEVPWRCAAWVVALVVSIRERQLDGLF